MRRWILGSQNSLAIQLALHDVFSARSIVLVDPRGHSVDTILSLVPQERREDVLLFDPTDFEYPIAWNPLYNIPDYQKAHTASLLLDAFRAANKYTHLSTPDFNLTLYSCLVALLDANGTLLGVPFMLTNDKYRRKIVKQVKDPMIRNVWDTFEGINKKDRDQITKSTRTNITLLMADPRIRNVLGQPRSAFSINDIKILLVRLPIAKLGKVKVNLLGSLVLGQLLAAEAGAHIYVVDPHLFDGAAIIDATESLGITVSNTYLGELPHELQTALFGNMDERYVFRVGIEDSDRLQRTFEHNNTEPKPHELAPFEALVFRRHVRSRRRFPPIRPGKAKDTVKVANLSRLTYAASRVHVEKQLARFMEGLE